MAPTPKRETQAVARFFLDSACASGAALAEEIKSAGIQVPAVVDRVLGGIPEKLHGKVLDSVLSGMKHYEREHGCAAPAELIEVAMHQGFAGGIPEDKLQTFDSASSAHHDQLSLQPNRAVTSIISTFTEAIPYAAYLPTDIQSNEARLAIVSHHSKSEFGEYAADASIDGIAGGGMFLDSERVVELSTNGGGASGSPLTAVVSTKFTGYVPDAVGGSIAAVPLLRGRTALLVNGQVAATEVKNTSGSGANAIAGTAKIAGADYVLSGTVNPDTGAISVTSNPALPANTLVHALAYIDFEKAPQLAPKIGVLAQVFQLYARASRGIMETSIDAQTQIANELSVDPQSEALLALRAQFAQERHYRVLARMKMIGAQIPGAFDFDHAGQKDQKTRAQILLDLGSELARVSQLVANATNDHGIDTLYVTGFLAAMFQSLPAEMWTPSGIPPRAGIYRLGRFLGLYDVYYTPKGLKETGGGAASEILAVGRSSQVARNPIVMGDAVPPMFLPLNTDSRMVYGQGFYARSFTDVNPHAPSAQGAALIAVTNMK